ncbi:MAG: transposase [Gammaproteobacteria bacterium]
MTHPRSTLISLEDTPYYHIVSRCIRKSFLCGLDVSSGKNFEHRRQWIADRLILLASAFSIEIASYAIMSNHYHLVLCVNDRATQHWSMREVLERWCMVFRGPTEVQDYLSGKTLNDTAIRRVSDYANLFRSRLCSISWFMRCINEPIARMANREDNCTGRFWEGRFKSQALLDESAVLSAMAYVDLNPIRAQLADTPESSDFTSIQDRIERIKRSQHVSHINTAASTPKHLQSFSGNAYSNEPSGIPIRLEEYLHLVDWTGKILRDDKNGYIPENIPPILERLKIDTKQWLYCTQHFESRFKKFVGKYHSIQKICQSLNHHWVQGIRNCRMAFG